MSGLSLPLAFFDFVNAPSWSSHFWNIGLGGIGAVVAPGRVVYAVLQWPFPKVAAIAWTTAKKPSWQPHFYILLGVGVFLLILSLFLPYFTFGEDVKVVEENGLTVGDVMSIILGLWTAAFPC